jgi:glycosyltransferase involved in cell wall biosynthesis
MKLLITFNGRFLGRSITGVDRLAVETIAVIDDLIARRDEAISGMEFRIAVPNGTSVVSPFEKIPVVPLGRFSGQFWEQFELPLHTGGQVLVNLCNTGPLSKRNQLVLIHDVATVRVPHSYSWTFRLWYSLLIPRLYRRSMSVCTVSRFSRDELRAAYGPRADVPVLPEGVNHIARIKPDQSIIDRCGLRVRPYVLAVSSLAPHKNFSVVLRTMEILGDPGFDVVVAGGQNPRVFSAAGSNLSSAVKYVGYVTDEELKALYTAAACFVFPSLYEGYGLPPTEAMACGCPVLASNRASIPEICGDAAIYFDPTDPHDLADKLRMVMGDKSLRETLSKRGFELSSGMNWRNTALALLDQIRKAANDGA